MRDCMMQEGKFIDWRRSYVRTQYGVLRAFWLDGVPPPCMIHASFEHYAA